MGRTREGGVPCRTADVLTLKSLLGSLQLLVALSFTVLYWDLYLHFTGTFIFYLSPTLEVNCGERTLGVPISRIFFEGRAARRSTGLERNRCLLGRTLRLWKRFQRFGREKHAIDKLRGITGWRLHDLRRTIVSGMAQLAFPRMNDKILNHQAGTISGVAAIYQRHDFLAQRKEALDRWGGHVGEIIQAEVRAADS